MLGLFLPVDERQTGHHQLTNVAIDRDSFHERLPIVRSLLENQIS
jgi:hypothetical protein